MLEVNVSGSYRSRGEIVDYDNETVTIPECDQEWILSNLINRALKMHFEKKEGKKFDTHIVVYINNVNKTDKNPTFCGKSIKALNWNEIQEAAIAFKLLPVPLSHSCNLIEARRKLYFEYATKKMNTSLPEDFNYSEANDLYLPLLNEKTKKTVDNP